ncbi:imm11 family protein [Archangium lansingense]|uniref:imm11 family protein n=1 Tax=Archangium lansingense TaxID=2995310 RepID=UPI003B7D4535
MTDNMRIPGRWQLQQLDIDDRGQPMDPWQYDRGERLELEGVQLIGVGHPGIALEFSSTELAIPVVSGRVVSIFERLGLLDEVQFIPARVEGQSEPYFILNTLRIIRCIDDSRCEEVLYWQPEDERPDKLGKYRNVVGLKVDPAKVGGANIFRPWGWTVALIVSERVKLAMEADGITGPKFIEA